MANAATAGWPDDAELVTWFEQYSNRELAAKFGRSVDAVRSKRGRLLAGGAIKSILNDPPLRNAQRDRPTHPQGFEPGVRWDGNKGEIVSRPQDGPNPNWESILRDWGYDPETVEIIEPIQVRTWDAIMSAGAGKPNIVRQMWYYKANLRTRIAGHLKADTEDLIREIKRFKPSNRPVVTGDRALIVAFSDWQLGKEGTEAATERILTMFDSFVSRLKELRRLGRQIDTLYVLLPGDGVEQCDGFYDMQAFTTVLNRRDQIKLGRRLIAKFLMLVAPLFSQIVVAAVPGNHGENRKDGKAYTDFGDNADLEVVEQVADMFGMNTDAFSHISFVIPKNELTLTLDVKGRIVGLAHGHQAGGSGDPQKKVKEWWKNQMFGMRPVGDADIIVTGHFHHFSIIQNGPRTHFQCPTMDSGSQWFEEVAGVPTIAGTLTFLVGKDGWSDLEIL